jgi:hypothetical protein
MNGRAPHAAQARPRRLAVGLAVLAGVLLAGCGEAYQRGDAGVFTLPARTTAPAPATVAVGSQRTDATGTESNEAPPATAAQRRAAARASDAARAFLRGYLPYSYAKAPATAIHAAASSLRAALADRPPRVPAALARRARPRLARLQLSSAQPREVYLLAHIDDGAAAYVALLTVRRTGARWLVTAVQ